MGMGMDEIQNMKIKVSAYDLRLNVCCDIVKMFAKSVNKMVFCLAHILDITSRACDAIYDVVAFAINSNFATISVICGF